MIDFMAKALSPLFMVAMVHGFARLVYNRWLTVGIWGFIVMTAVLMTVMALGSLGAIILTLWLLMVAFNSAGLRALFWIGWCLGFTSCMEERDVGIKVVSKINATHQNVEKDNVVERNFASNAEKKRKQPSKNAIAWNELKNKIPKAEVAA